MKNSRRPSSMMTKNRIIPFLTTILKENLIEATELDDCNNTFFDDPGWNHKLVLSIGDDYEVTFAIPDQIRFKERLKEDMHTISIIYQRLQELFQTFGSPLSLISMQTNDFGMLLPPSFYNPELKDNPQDNEEKSTCYINSEPSEETLEKILEGFLSEEKSFMSMVDETLQEQLKTLSKEEGEIALKEYNESLSELDKYQIQIQEYLSKSVYSYCVQPMLDRFYIFMDEGRKWGRELCICWPITAPVELLTKLDAARPIINNIKELTNYLTFAFGVKKKGSSVIQPDKVNAR